MPLLTSKFFTTDMVASDRTVLWIFGDNLAERGRGGQAKACRDQPNALGIPTKRFPTMQPYGFCQDSDLERVKEMSIPRFRRAADHLRAGGTVMIPEDGIGTGRALLSEKAPAIGAWIQSCFQHLNVINEEMTK